MHSSSLYITHLALLNARLKYCLINSITPIETLKRIEIATEIHSPSLKEDQWLVTNTSETTKTDYKPLHARRNRKRTYEFQYSKHDIKILRQKKERKEYLRITTEKKKIAHQCFGKYPVDKRSKFWDSK